MACARDNNPPLLAIDLGARDLGSGALAALVASPRPPLLSAVRAFCAFCETPKHPEDALVARTVSRLVSALKARFETTASREVATTFLATTRSVDAIVAFASDVSRRAPPELFDRWTRKAVVRAAAERGRDVLEDVLERTAEFMPATSRDLVGAAVSWICTGEPASEPTNPTGWEAAGSDPASRALLAVAFGTERVPVEFHEMSGREAIQNLVWAGLKVRDLGLVDDDALWRFYERCEDLGRSARGVDHSRDARVRAWLVDMGSRRVTSEVQEACITLALAARTQR